MTMKRLFLKKITDNKLQTAFSIFNMAIGLIVLFITITICINGYKLVSKWFESRPELLVLIADKNEESKDIALSEIDGINSYTKYYNENKYINCIGNIEMHELCTEYYGDILTLPESATVQGDVAEANSGILISVTYYNLISEAIGDVIGVEVKMSDGQITSITGVFDNSNENFKYNFLCRSGDTDITDKIVIKARDQSCVRGINDSLIQNGFSVFCYVDDIEAMQNALDIVKKSALLITLLVIILTSVLLYFSSNVIFDEIQYFLALIKAIGYRAKHFWVLIICELSLVASVSLVISLSLSGYVVKLIVFIFTQFGIIEVYGISIEQLFNVNSIAYLTVIVLSLLIVFTVSLLNYIKIRHSTVLDILSRCD